MIEDHSARPEADGRAFHKNRAISTFGLRAILFWFLLLCSAAAAPPGPDQEGHASDSPTLRPTPSPAEVSRAIALAAGYLERACGPDGKFAYKVDIGSGRESSSSYDIIRHEGAMYGLAMFNQSHPDPQAAAALLRAAKFLRENYIGPGVRPGQQVVWSQPVGRASDSRHADGPQFKRQQRYAELGGTGLGLVALAAVRQVDPHAVPLEELQALGRFALFLQKDDGSFVHKYVAESGPVTNWTSLYYPGEAVLGLVALYEADHSREWLVAAGKALAYLARTRAGLSTVPADHWALIATARLLPYRDRIASTVSREELIQHAVQICSSILHEQFHGSEATGIDGAFDAMGRTAPAATRLEGLLAALEFLPKDDLSGRVEAAVERGIALLLRAQVTSGPYAGGMPGAVRTSALDSSEVRADFVQHALSAWLRFYRLQGNGLCPF